LSTQALLRSRMRNLLAFRGLDREERKATLQAFLMLPVVAGAVKLRGLQRVQARLAVGPESRRSSHVEPVRLGHLVNRVAAPWRANCLTRSLVTWWLLGRAGVVGDLRIGVRQSDQGLDFHAWIEADGLVINDRSDIADEFTPFAHPIAPGQRFV